jgi:hypothetical protein
VWEQRAATKQPGQTDERSRLSGSWVLFLAGLCMVSLQSTVAGHLRPPSRSRCFVPNVVEHALTLTRLGVALPHPRKQQVFVINHTGPGPGGQPSDATGWLNWLLPGGNAVVQLLQARKQAGQLALPPPPLQAPSLRESCGLAPDAVARGKATSSPRLERVSRPCLRTTGKQFFVAPRQDLELTGSRMRRACIPVIRRSVLVRRCTAVAAERDTPPLPVYANRRFGTWSSHSGGLVT